MSQEIELSGTKLLAEDAIAFLESLNAHKQCPVCDNNVWHVTLSPGGGRYLALQTVGGREVGPAPVMGIFTTNCSKCGYVRVHGLGVLKAWKMSQGAGDGAP